METFVNRSKYVSETISIIADFSDVLAPFETIQGVPVVTVNLETGDDPSPSDILYLGVLVHNGKVVEQRFRLGVPGTIYEITFQIVSNLFHTFEKTVYLAILPSLQVTPPENIFIYLTSTLYPIVAEDGYRGISPIAARGLFMPKETEDYTAQNPSVLSGTLVNQIIRYTQPPDNYRGISPVAVSGTLVNQIIRYTQPSDNYKGAVAVLSGALVTVIIRYTQPSDNYSGITPTVLGGTLA